ncbi:MAG TPA: hypothetical protein VMU16_04405 [Candidatus Binataceae bacterium]|nr:hypothetical protein [Candidatus Binataceae bacterium]
MKYLLRGQTMTEYALILTVVAIVVFFGYQGLGRSITGPLSYIDAVL